MKELLTLCITSRPGDSRDLECLEKTIGWTSLHDILLKIVKINPYSMSAELNAMKPWLQSESNYVESVKLYNTQTGPGILSAVILKRYLQHILGKDKNIDMKSIEGFDKGFWLGIANLLEKATRDLRSILRSGKDNIIMLNATGGFKPESAYLILSGMYNADGRAFTYYIHELHKETTIIPLVLSRKLIEEARKLITRYKPYSPSGIIKIPVSQLGNAEWLKYYAYILKPMNKGEVNNDYIAIDDKIARVITMLL